MRQAGSHSYFQKTVSLKNCLSSKMIETRQSVTVLERVETHDFCERQHSSNTSEKHLVFEDKDSPSQRMPQVRIRSNLWPSCVLYLIQIVVQRGSVKEFCSLKPVLL